MANTIMSKKDGVRFVVDENDAMLNGNGNGNVGADANNDAGVVFKVYPERWWLLLTVVLLNLANYSHWVAFPSVAKNAAKYYDQVGQTCPSSAVAQEVAQIVAQEVAFGNVEELS